MTAPNLHYLGEEGGPKIMKRQQNVLLFSVLLGFILLISPTAFALTVGEDYVSYTVSGTPGDWTLDFHVTNYYGVTNEDIYWFGVSLSPGDTIVGSPPGWAEFLPNGIYNLMWIDYPGFYPADASIASLIENGETLNGFLVKDQSATAPASVLWFAAHHDFEGPAGDIYKEGTARQKTSTIPGVPEPSTILLCGFGLSGLILVRKRFTKR
jgi:hypothetical protein